MSRKKNARSQKEIRREKQQPEVNVNYGCVLCVFATINKL